MKLDMNVNLQQLLVTMGTLLCAMLFSFFNLKSAVNLQDREIEELKKDNQVLESRIEKRDEKLEQWMGEIKDDVVEIKLSLKDKADREGN